MQRYRRQPNEIDKIYRIDSKDGGGELSIPKPARYASHPHPTSSRGRGEKQRVVLSSLSLIAWPQK